MLATLPPELQATDCDCYPGQIEEGGPLAPPSRVAELDLPALEQEMLWHGVWESPGMLAVWEQSE